MRLVHTIQGSAQTIFSGGNLVNLGICIFAMYVFVYPASVQTAVSLIYSRRQYG